MAVAQFTPNQSQWSQATQAGAHAIDPPFSDRQVPVEHRADGSYTILRQDYPNGIVLIPANHDPSGVPAVLPVIVTSGSQSSVTLDPSNTMDFPYGGGLIFV